MGGPHSCSPVQPVLFKEAHEYTSQDNFTTLPIQRWPQLSPSPQHPHRQSKSTNRRNRRRDRVNIPTPRAFYSSSSEQEATHQAVTSNGVSRFPSIWLIELARTLAPSAQLDGLDISFAQCPPKEWLPANISWITHDVLSEPPPSLLEKYDIIHVQLFITILRDGNPVPMLRNLMKMLSEFFVSSLRSIFFAQDSPSLTWSHGKYWKEDKPRMKEKDQ